VIAAVFLYPPATCFQLVPPANVVTGVFLWVVVLSPSCPLALRPQLHKVPSVLIANICPYPLVTCFQLVPPANVVTGVFLWVVVLSPICPLKLAPQVHRVPSILIADV
jgi:hypothetical protein